MPNFDLEYNSQREQLIIPEYGRNFQKLIDHCRGIEDKNKRQEFVEGLIELMQIMIPSNKNLEDRQQKMWNHLMKIANYDLDVDIPEGIVIHKTASDKGEHDLTYPKSTYKFRHYGAYIQKMITQARETEDKEKKKIYSDAIASYMKLAYQTWNKEHYVNDNIIVQDLEEISEGELTFQDDYSIENLVSINQLKSKHSKKGKSSNNNRKRSKKSNHKRR